MGSTKSIPSIKQHIILIEYEQKYSIKTLYKRKQDFIPLDLFLKYNQRELNNLGKDYLVKNNISFCYYKKSDIRYYIYNKNTITNCGLTAYGLINICLQKTNGYLSLYNRFYLEMEEYLRFDKNPIVIVTAINSINTAHSFIITKNKNDYILSQSSSSKYNIYEIKHTQFTFKELQKYLLDDYVIEYMDLEDKMEFPTFLWRKVIFN